MTGAKLRVIRALLGVKGTYTKAELQKNFAIPTVIFSPDFSDPQVRQAMLTQGMNSVNNMFGTPQIAVKSVDFESESTVFTQDDLDNPACLPLRIVPVKNIRRTVKLHIQKIIIS